MDSCYYKLSNFSFVIVLPLIGGIIFFALYSSSEMTSSDIRNPQTLITSDSSCQERCDYQPQAARCRCDPQCEIFQDCCYDYHLCNTSSTMMKKEIGTLDPALFTCVPLDRDNPSLGTVMLVSKCPVHWNDELIKHRCENLPSLYADPAERLTVEWPVSDENGENYQNLFCAICNGKDISNVQSWDVKYPPEITFNRIKEISPEECGDLGNLGRVGKRLRYCLPSLITSCPASSTANKSLSQICESYSNHVCTPGKRYKNYHCALCNDVDSTDLTPCLKTDFHGSVVLQKIWTFKETPPTTDHFVQRCEETNTIYDPYTNGCRSISCPPGYELNKRSECIVASGRSDDISGLCCSQQLSWVFLANDDISRSDESNAELNDYIVLQILHQVNASMDGDINHWKRSHNFGMKIDKRLLQSNSSCNVVTAIDDILLNPNNFTRLCNCMSFAYIYTCSNSNSNNSTDVCAGKWYSGKASDFKLVSFGNMTEVFLKDGQYILPKFTLHHVVYKHSEKGNEVIKDERVHVCGESTKLLLCPLITLSLEDYTMSWTENGSRVILFGDNPYDQGEFILYPDGRIQICAENWTTPVNAFFAYSGHLATANIIGSSLSLFGLFVSFVLHCRFKLFRNFHGRCIMCLCSILFMAQLLPMLSAEFSFPHGVCVFSAIVSHYSWLSAFSWMTVIAINLLHIFSCGASRRNKEWEAGTFCRYIAPAVGFGVPLVVVVTSISFHFTYSSFAYGVNSPCWISDSVGNIFAFGVPAGIFLVTNLIIFSATVVLACRSQRRSRQLRQRKNNIRTLVTDLLLCTKVMYMLIKYLCLIYEERHIFIRSITLFYVSRNKFRAIH